MGSKSFFLLMGGVGEGGREDDFRLNSGVDAT
jgi:hypothetical protein